MADGGAQIGGHIILEAADSDKLGAVAIFPAAATAAATAVGCPLLASSARRVKKKKRNVYPPVRLGVIGTADGDLAAA
ncbi:hypothetical protein N7509_006022 [Penicillium cosmopolitanum]|uniref:Uncharacterized protein n=1 Tax=Penicillium cosmopolitanum TaxID=1131564 RepID=A0A9X0BAP1_9EURO|nr:uncharacterized protein N7509_006022 [Penicillium cosmopolitanum]KAJ5397909.1 hypothetical protein N7509_006022 [Penicillium cosmopolitanum]